jgi:Lrp/AsnC family leucine-responsive transcriptional regulator
MGYRAVVDPRKAGYSLSALVSLSSNSSDEQIMNEELSLIPEVVSCWSITGTNDYLLEIQVPSLEFLEELLTELARHGRLTTSIVLPSSARKSVITPPRMSMTD